LLDNSNQKSNNEPELKSANDQAKTVPASDILNSLKAELFDPGLAEKYQKAQEAAQAFFAIYTELQRAGFTKQEAYGMVIAMCGGK